MSRSLLACAGALVVTLACTSACRAQSAQASDPAHAVTESPAAAPLTLAADPAIDRLQTPFIGSFRAADARAAGGGADGASGAAGVALWFHACPIQVTGLDNALYYEIAREDSPAAPFSQGVLHFYRAGKSGEFRLRQYLFNGVQQGALTGLWCDPSSLPTIDAAHLFVRCDLAVRTDEPSKGALTAASAGRFPVGGPTGVGAAVEAQTRLVATGDRLELTESGFDAAGALVWGASPDRGAPAVVFSREQPKWSPVRNDDGLVTITLVSGETGSEAFAGAGEVVVQYTGYFTDGRIFDSSRREGREPFRVRLPGPIIKGWADGLKGMVKGERRRIVIPPALAYGVRGRPPVIPPDSTLIFDVECLYVDNSPPPAQPQIPPVPDVPPPKRPAPAAPPGAEHEGSGR